jgi:hypothetical protein
MSKRRSRRRVLELGGLALTIGIPGCSGGEADTDDPTDTPTTEYARTERDSTDTEAATTTAEGTSALTETAKLVPADGDEDDAFGTSVSVTSDTALVGALIDEDPKGEDAGSAYLFSNSETGWQQTQKLSPDDGEEGDHFGTAVALVDGLALVSATGAERSDTFSTGTAYVFDL